MRDTGPVTRTFPVRWAALIAGTGVALSACGAVPAAAPSPAMVAAVAASASPLAALHAVSLPAASTQLTGRVIVIDPGHNARGSSKLVPAGNGKKKACNSSGTATNSGYTEHAYNWAQAKALAAELRSRGATVLFTRSNDTGQGPCVNLRSKLANEQQADVLFSIHADGNYSKSARGFHVIISTTMAGGSAIEAKSKALAKQVRAALQAETAMPRSTYIGKGTALSSRSDLATLNFSQRVAVMMEMGNMRHAKDAALLKSAAWRAKAAVALADGIAAYLG